MTTQELRLDRMKAWCGEANVLPRDCGWYCDGHTLLRAEYVKRPKPYMLRSTHDATDVSDVAAKPAWCRGGRPPVPAEGVQRILSGCSATDGEMWTVSDTVTVPELPRRGVSLPPAMVELTGPKGANPVYLDAHKVKLIAQCCGEVEYRVVGYELPVRLVKDGELIGLLMPLRA